MTDLELFSRVPESALGPYLHKERANAFKVLAANKDLATLHQYQGRVQLVEEMLALLDKAKNLR